MNRTIVFTVLLAFSGFALTGCEQEKKNGKSESSRGKKICPSDCFRGCGQQ